MATQDNFDFESFKKDAIAGLYAGKKMTGTDGVLAPMMKHFLVFWLVNLEINRVLLTRAYRIILLVLLLDL